MTEPRPPAALPGRRPNPWPALRALLPQRADYAGLARCWRSDLVAGLTVGVVALPLALAFGITSGIGAAAGLTTAIVAGIVAAVFGGSGVQVSGPTGAMTVVLVPLVGRYGADAVVVVGVLAGILVVAAGLLRLGRVLAYIPWPVIEGFTLGIAVIIFLQQVPAALGVDKPEGENTAVVAGRALADAFGGGSPPALALVGVTVAIMVLGPRFHRALPASLLAVIIATVVAVAAGWDVATIGALPSALSAPHVPAIELGQLSAYLGPAFAVAMLAAIESLLSAKVADGMSDGPRHNPDRELVGQGLANIAAPIFGGKPATGAIARTAVNVRSGGRTRVASIVHALVLVAVVLVGSGVVARIPLAALAGVLMVTAVRMVETHNIATIVRSTRSDALVLVLTAAATVVFDLIVAVEIGVAAAAVLALRNVARTTALTETPIPHEVNDREEHALLAEHIVAYRIDGALFFGAAQRFLTDFARIADVRVVILRLPDLQVLDATGAQALGEIVADLEARHITVLLKGARPEHERVLRTVGALAHLDAQRHIFVSLDDAIAHARLHVTDTPHGPDTPRLERAA
ncbi:MAG: SulP family inorganic anion transporter [Actinomycetota bacterium]|nr:SulP family inorganic anion transporter [Actinomycetota bacterium]